MCAYCRKMHRILFSKRDFYSVVLILLDLFIFLCNTMMEQLKFRSVEVELFEKSIFVSILPVVDNYSNELSSEKLNILSTVSLSCIKTNEICICLKTAQNPNNSKQNKHTLFYKSLHVCSFHSP